MDRQQVAHELPLLRRYGRALTGSQSRGDGLVRHMLEALVVEPKLLDDDVNIHVSIFALFHRVLKGIDLAGTESESRASTIENVVQSRLGATAPMGRQILLLTVLENFTLENAAHIVGISVAEAEIALTQALTEIDRQSRSSVLIIEDEPMIALELETHVTNLGHEVVGTATTHREAVSMYHEFNPGLILADVQLADGSSGTAAVREILASESVPVIFITAFPERLLTGERPEPTYLITKPFTTQSVKVAISQALFIKSTARTISVG